jgi:uncharacterized protein with ParB-like and HNH nuclease domain
LNNVQTVEEVFAGRIMQVPDYQRGYAWDERNWDDFLDDLDLLEPGKHHYTGTLVNEPIGRRRVQTRYEEEILS